MKINPEYYLKWISADNKLTTGLDYKLINHCVLCAQGKDKKVSGFTAFPTRDLNFTILERLEKRRQNFVTADTRFVLYAPEFLRYRVETLLKDKDVELVFTSFVRIRHKSDHFVLRDKIRVVSVDDSPVLLKFIGHTLSEFGFAVSVATISNPLEAEKTIRALHPDVVTLDIQMPEMTGVQVLRNLLAKEYFPVIMISSLGMEEGSMVFDALNSGAFDYIQKPEIQMREAFKEELKTKLLIAAESEAKPVQAAVIQKQAKKAAAPSTDYPPDLIWCLGSSTGGTQALTRIFTSMPEKVPPTLIVQHMPPEFSRAFAEGLNNLVPFTVKEAENGEAVLPDHVYVAPGGKQMSVQKHLSRLVIVVNDDAPVNRFKPSVDYLFNSVKTLQGVRCVAGILTGMGKDGAQGLLDLKNTGARTLAQDEKSCIVYGMPRAAVEIGAVDRSVSLDDFSHTMLVETATLAKKRAA